MPAPSLYAPLAEDKQGRCFFGGLSITLKFYRPLRFKDVGQDAVEWEPNTISASLICHRARSCYVNDKFTWILIDDVRGRDTYRCGGSSALQAEHADYVCL
jgi:hypothetical protein